MTVHADAGSRQFPARPIVAVGAVVIDGNRVLLVKRGREPLKGDWSLPGGAVEIGETLSAAVVREVREETCLDVAVGPVIEVVDRIRPDGAGRIEYHYVIVDYLCRVQGGTAACASDAEAVEWIERTDLVRYSITPGVAAVIEKAFTASTYSFGFQAK
jgi:8-oxo-dGTP diphosphatase